MAGVDLSAAHWRRSSYSGYGNEGNCVEVAALPTVIAVRDSKAPRTDALTLSTTAWSRLRAGLRP